jgi:hypothetical protein
LHNRGTSFGCYADDPSIGIDNHVNCDILDLHLHHPTDIFNVNYLVLQFRLLNKQRLRGGGWYANLPPGERLHKQGHPDLSKPGDALREVHHKNSAFIVPG